MNVDITGYPGEKRRQMWKMNGHIEESFPNKIRYVIDTTGGQSGCPVYLKNGGYKSIAINTNGGYTCNKATRITKDRKSTRLNSSHANISYAVFCLKKKKTT